MACCAQGPAIVVFCRGISRRWFGLQFLLSLKATPVLISHTTRCPPSPAHAQYDYGRLSAGLLSAYEYWVYGWGWNSLAIILEEHYDGIECSTRAAGRDVHGWDCIFRPMPHICTFRTLEVSFIYLSLDKNCYHAYISRSAF